MHIQGNVTGLTSVSNVENITLDNATTVASGVLSGQTISLAGSTALTLNGAGTSPVTIDASHFTTTGTNTMELVGSDAADTITGSELADAITGGSGDDTITGGDGADNMTGGTGNDTFVLGSATQTGDVINGFSFGTSTTTEDVLAFDLDGSGETGAFTRTRDQATTLLAGPGLGGESCYQPSPGEAYLFAVPSNVDNTSVPIATTLLTFDSAETFSEYVGTNSKTLYFSDVEDPSTGVFLALVDTGADVDVYTIAINNSDSTDGATGTKIATLVGVNDFSNLNEDDIIFI